MSALSTSRAIRAVVMLGLAVILAVATVVAAVLIVTAAVMVVVVPVFTMIIVVALVVREAGRPFGFFDVGVSVCYF